MEQKTQGIEPDPDPNVTLDLTSQSVDSKTLGEIELKRVTDLTWHDLNSTQLKLLFALFPDIPIRRLDISRQVCHIHELLSNVVFAPTLKSVTHLLASGVFLLTKSTVAEIADEFPHLTELNLACSGLNNVSALKKLTALTSLNLSNNYLDDASIQTLRKMKLQSLDVSRNDITNSGLQRLIKSKTLMNLNVANQRIHYITHETRDKLNTMLIRNKERQPKVRKYPNVGYFEEDNHLIVDLRDNDKEYSFPKKLSKDYPNAEWLNLQYLENEDEDECKAGLSGKTRFPIRKFKHLHQINVFGFQHLPPDIFKNKSVEVLRIGCCNLEDESLLKGLRQNSNITELHISDSQMNDNFFIELLKIPSILEIYVMRIPLTRIIIPSILANTSLRTLRITPFDFGDDRYRVNQHLGQNEARRRALMRTVPLLAAMQVGGPLKNSAKDLLPMIYGFMHDPRKATPKPELVTKIMDESLPKVFTT